jgi:hypothetical protein
MFMLCSREDKTEWQIVLLENLSWTARQKENGLCSHRERAIKMSDFAILIVILIISRSDERKKWKTPYIH